MGRRNNSNAALTERDSAQMAQSDDGRDDVRWEKVLSLRAAIACGRYRISAEALAGKLIEHMLAVPRLPAGRFDGTSAARFDATPEVRFDATSEVRFDATKDRP